MKENDIVRACLDILTMKKIFHYRNNSGAFVSEYKGSKRFVRFGATGSPDIVAIIDGKYVAIECKVGKGKQSPGQVEFERKLKQAGGIYLLVYTPEDLLLKL